MPTHEQLLAGSKPVQVKKKKRLQSLFLAFQVTSGLVFTTPIIVPSKMPGLLTSLGLYSAGAADSK